MIRALSASLLDEIKEKANKSRGDIIAMTYLAGSGHPGGSMSSIDIYTLLYHVVDLDQDKVIISHGHTSPGVYSALARRGLFDPKEVIKGFRRLGSMFEGHVEPTVPGVVWGTGNLGQGLSVACGYAVAARVKGENSNFFVVMGDGEQQKGQIAEARRFIRKYHLNNITVIIDNNKLQISGDRDKVMPQNLKAEYEEAGFTVLEIDGHDLMQIYNAILKAANDKGKAYAIIANTIMGKGISFMEGKADYHGRALNKEEMQKAMSEIKLEWPLEELEILRKEPIAGTCACTEHVVPFPKVSMGKPKPYEKTASTDNRSAMGDALVEVAEANRDVAIVVFDCDLAGSVKTAKFGSKFPDRFFQAGISEHNTAVMAGAASTCGVISVFADFGMFGIDETYNQQRLNAINSAHVKLLCTHIGIDVGEDGKTHQCIDYLGLMKNTGFHVIIPIDPKETDLATRWALTNPGNCLVAMGRSKTPIVTDEADEMVVREFVYGRVYHLRKGDAATLFSLGAMNANALRAWKILKDKGIQIEVVGVSCPLSLEVEEIADAAKRGPVFVVEDHLEVSGLASQIAYTAATNRIAIELIPMGIKGFPPSGPSGACYKHYGLDPESLANTIMKRIKIE